MSIEAKRKELLHMDDRAMLSRILAFPDRQRLNRDEDGVRRKYPSAEMAVRVCLTMERDPSYTISAKQKYVMADSFARYSTDQLKVVGVTFAKADPKDLEKNLTKSEGVKSVYDMKFHLVPEPDNPYDKNAVGVFVDRADGTGREKIGMMPAAYVGEHPILSPVTVDGTLTDHSNGHFKTISYVMNMDTEAIDQEIQRVSPSDTYTYRMPFILNGNAKEGAGQYLNESCDWTRRLNDELEYWGVNGTVDNVRFEFPGGKTGNILVESSKKLNSEAMGVCGSYFRYGLESGISSDLSRDGYVDCPSHLPAVNTRDKTYFSLAGEPDTEDFARAVDSLNDISQGLDR